MHVTHPKRTVFSVAAAMAVAALAVLVLAGPVSAHVSAIPGEAPAGSRADIAFAFSHGCGASPTTGLRIGIPAEVTSVTPNAHPGWDVTVVTEPLDPPEDDGHGGQRTERVAEVAFTAKQPVPDGVRDRVTLTVALPDAAGETLAFPTIQVCEEGEYAWIQVAAEGQDPHDLDEPAPLVALSASSGNGDHGHGDHAGDDAGSDTDTLTWVALGVGVLGVILGGASLLTRRKA